MNTKLVTAYYPNHQGPPFWGKQGKNKLYKNSIASICGMGASVVCYTDNQSLSELIQLKEEKKLNNLVIKLHNLEINPLQKRIYNIRVTYPELYNNESNSLYEIPFIIHWMKWNFLQMEYEPDTYLYWVNAGLADGIILNPKRLKAINDYTEGKILNVCTNDIHEFENKLEPIVDIDKFPIGIIFGGNSPYLLDYIKLLNKIIETTLNSEDYLCTEQEIMSYAHAAYPEWFKDWMFNTSFDNFFSDDLSLSKTSTNTSKKSLGNK